MFAVALSLLLVGFGKPRPKEIDLRQFAGPIKAQEGGSCTAHAVANALEIGIKGRAQVDAMAFWRRYALPYTSAARSEAKRAPLETFGGGLVAWTGGPAKYYFIKSEAEAKEWLSKGVALAMAIPVYRSLAACKVVIPDNDGVIRGVGHAVAVVGWKPGFYLIENSWGNRCGDQGFQWLSTKLFHNEKEWHELVAVVPVELVREPGPWMAKRVDQGDTFVEPKDRVYPSLRELSHP